MRACCQTCDKLPAILPAVATGSQQFSRLSRLGAAAARKRCAEQVRVAQELALQLLKGKLLAVQQEQELQRIADIRGDLVRAEWGQQIRNYTLNPYRWTQAHAELLSDFWPCSVPNGCLCCSLVKDVRTRHESSQVEAVLDGGLMPFMQAYLQYRGEQAAQSQG